MNGEQTRKYPETVEVHLDAPWYIYDLGDTQKLGSPDPLTDEQVEREIKLFTPPPPHPYAAGIASAQAWAEHRRATVDTAEVLEADDTVPVERLAKWMQERFGPKHQLAKGNAELVRESYRQTARELRADLPELFR